MMKVELIFGLVCVARVACAVPTADAPTTDGSALDGFGEKFPSPAAALQHYVDRQEIVEAGE